MLGRKRCLFVGRDVRTVANYAHSLSNQYLRMTAKNVVSAMTASNSAVRFLLTIRFSIESTFNALKLCR